VRSRLETVTSFNGRTPFEYQQERRRAMASSDARGRRGLHMEQPKSQRRGPRSGASSALTSNSVLPNPGPTRQASAMHANIMDVPLTGRLPSSYRSVTVGDRRQGCLLHTHHTNKPIHGARVDSGAADPSAERGWTVCARVRVCTSARGAHVAGSGEPWPPG